MANKNTMAARRRGLSNMDVTTVGTGTSRQIVERHAEPTYKGSVCDTAWDSTHSKKKRAKRYGA